MRQIILRAFGLAGLVTVWSGVWSQQRMVDSSLFCNQVLTYVNPVLPGDHPDPTLIRVGKDFYHCGSSFHFNPYLPVYHSTDLVHWEVISRVVPSSRASFVTDRPSAGIWQGAITYFYGSYRVYFSSGGQWFCKASSPYGPWSAPVAVKTDSATGWLGYDNSIFVDDNGKPYMVIKNGQKVNRLQALGRDGQLTDTVINLDWINASLQYSWAEGPVMCKRNGYYYYFPAGDVSGGQYVLRTRELTSDSTKWERLGDFFKPVTDGKVGFRRPNHIAAPLELADGSWWTIGQSYEKYPDDDWSGTGRQTSLFPVIWEGDRPWGMAPVSAPIELPRLSNSGIPSGLPGLSNSGIPWRSVHSDGFEADSLGLWWHFLNRAAAQEYSLGVRKGWIRLTPSGDRAHVVQKETDHYYTAVTRVEVDASDTADKAGILLSNGNQQVLVRLYSGFDNGRKIILRMNGQVRIVANAFGKNVWLKLVREGHELTGYCSGDGKVWTEVGEPLSAVALDKTQPGFNSWVGTSVGLFAEGRPADFDRFVGKDGFSPLAAAGYSNYFGVETVGRGEDRSVTNTSEHGGWLMISGVYLDEAAKITVDAVASRAGALEIWVDDLAKGRKIASVALKGRISDGEETATAELLKPVAGSHDIFVKFPAGMKQAIFLKHIVFTKKK